MNRSQPGGNRAEDFHGKNKVAVQRFIPCAQSQLPDNRQFKGDLLAAAIQVRQAQLALQDALYVLENQLEEALDRDEEGA